MKQHVLVSVCLGMLVFLVPQTGHAASGVPQAAGQTAVLASGQPATPGPDASQAPVIRFDPAGVDLAEAVRLTLQHGPNIKLAEAAAGRQSGVAQEQTGLFDTSLLANGGYNYQRQALTTSARQAEGFKRLDLANAARDQQANAKNLQFLSAQLKAAQATAPGYAQLTQIQALDPNTATSIQMIDALYQANFTDDKFKNSLLQMRNQLISDSINAADKGVDAALAGYTQLNQMVTDLGAAPIDEFFFKGNADVSASRLFRNGITFTPFFSGDTNGTNYVGKPNASQFGGKGVLPLYTFKLGFNSILPLARNLGSDATAAFERSSYITEQATTLEARHEISRSALDTVNAYWALRAAQDNVAVLGRAVDIQTKLVDLTKGSINAGEMPAVELARVQASEARARAQLRDAERALQSTRVALATAMGISATGDESTLPKAKDPFPPAPNPLDVSEPQMVALAASAIPQRLDVTAASRRQEAAQILVRGASLNLKPRVDLTAGAWYTGLDESKISSALDRWVGPSYNLSLDLEKPFGNNQQRGQLVQRRAESATSQITRSDLERQVRLNVVRLSRSLNEAIERAKQAQAAVDFYQKTIDAEIDRFRLGEVTLIDTITTQSQQTDAELALVAAQTDLAQLIAQLRFETGTLVANPNAVAPQDLVTVPHK